ncbi:hypothetical protein HPB50_022916 [Hyalomma asiaticum]|uniref:Uncharacterized protein n=1 Tax=Hyalomma asiaticum TaxID=266040 RepID=A0ACB7SKK7_HYAAI|nr:hypothetical protein HPB50_022916 [Hyalomma asiaticum]
MKTLVVVVIIQAICAVVTARPTGIPGVALKVPDPNDCSKYSLCLQLFGMKLDCPEGEHFSAAASQCLPAAVAGCDPGKYLDPF